MQKEKVHMKTTQENAGKKYELLCYTRKPEEDSIYSEKLACSMHLALREDGGSFVPLNHNSGILYAKQSSGKMVRFMQRA